MMLDPFNLTNAFISSQASERLHQTYLPLVDKDYLKREELWNLRQNIKSLEKALRTLSKRR